MAKKGSIGLFPLLVATVIGYNLFIDDDNDETGYKDKVIQTVKEIKDIFSDTEDEVKVQIDKAKEKYETAETDMEIVEKYEEEISQESVEPPPEEKDEIVMETKPDKPKEERKTGRKL